MASSLVPDISLVLSDLCGSPCWSWCYSYPAAPCTSNDGTGILGQVKGGQGEKRSRRSSPFPPRTTAPPIGRKDPFSSTLSTWGPCCFCPYHHLCWWGAAWGLRHGQTKEKGKRRNFHASLSFPLSESMLQGSSWVSGHLSAHSWLGSLSPAQGDTEKEKRPGTECWSNGTSKSCLPPSSVHHYLLVRVSCPRLQVLCPRYITSFHGRDTQSTLAPSYPEPELHPLFGLILYIWIFILIKCVLMSWEDLDSSFTMWLASCPNITECAVHLSCRLFYRCVSFESPMSFQRKLWWDNFSYVVGNVIWKCICKK